MRALITGADGFVGSHVAPAFRDRGWEVFPFDVLDRWDRQPPVDVVVSLAASANPREALRNPQGAYANGTRVMVDTLEFARQVGARVLHVSTNEVYGHKVGLPYEPRGPYAGAKACQEIVCETYQDVPVTIVVTQSLFGERQQPDKLVPTAIRKLLANEPIQLQPNGHRWASRPFLHARNLAEALLCWRRTRRGSITGCMWVRRSPVTSGPWLPRSRGRWTARRGSFRSPLATGPATSLPWSRSAATSKAGSPPTTRRKRCVTWPAGTATTPDGWRRMPLRWQILIPHIPHRHAKLLELLDVLAPRCGPAYRC